MKAKVSNLRRLGLGLAIESALPRPGPTGRVAVLLGLACMTLAAHAQYRFRTEVNPDGTLTIVRGSCPTGALNIPATIGGRKVTAIGIAAFLDCAGLTAVAIPNGVTSIENNAFASCTGLTNVTIPASVTFIGAQAFVNCPLGKEVIYNTTRTLLVWVPIESTGSFTIPDTVTAIGGSAFHGCRLTSVTIPDSVTSIGELAFYGCNRLTHVTIGNGVTTIGYYAFFMCTGLTNVTIPDGVRTIGMNAFSRCTGLTSVTFPDNVTSIGSWVFFECSLKDILFSKSRTTLVWYPPDRTGRYTIPNSVRTIASTAFYGCDGLTSVTIPAGMTSIWHYAFSYCTGLQAAYFEGEPPAFAPEAFRLTQTTIYYLPGTSGWSSTFAGRPTAPWVRTHPTILGFGDRFGLSTKGFGFTISWATNVPVVVEASTDIVSPTWRPISTNTLTDGWGQFADPDWANQVVRFYRVRGQ